MGQVIKHAAEQAKGEMGRLRVSWTSLFLSSFMTVYSYVFMEWLFDATKPSFLSAFSVVDMIAVYLVAAALVTGFIFLVQFLLVLVSLLPGLKKSAGWVFRLGWVFPALVAAALILMLIDNFTYTVLKFGIVSTHGIVRGFYGIFFIVLFGFGLRWVSQSVNWFTQRLANSNLRRFVLLVMVAISAGSLALMLFINGGARANLFDSAASLNSRPNILFITSDGLDASHTSVYGYQRDTTPRIKELSQTSLVAENAYTNSGNTSGSLLSFLTGKYPSQTRVVYPPDILKGQDAYQHLPGILQSQGYYAEQYGFKYYADAYTLNVLDGFNVANGRSLSPQNSILTRLRDFIPSNSAYFFDNMANRLLDRLLHIFFIQKMSNPYDLVTNPSKDMFDSTKLKDMLDLLHNATQPVFVQIHFMVTHGPGFYPKKQVYSAGQDVMIQKPWNDDFYDDSILEFDQDVGAIIDQLKKDSIFDRTILVISSDHGQTWVTGRRIPLIIHFPGGQYAGKIQENVQNIDVAPTILDYLGVAKPAWMEGQSILEGNLGNRLIFGLSVNGATVELDPKTVFGADPPRLEPPFYQFGLISLVDCNRWYQLDLVGQQFGAADVKGATSPCSSKLSNEQVMRLIIDHLNEHGFDTSSLLK